MYSNIYLEQENHNTPSIYTRILTDIDSSLKVPSKDVTNNHTYGNNLVKENGDAFEHNYFYPEHYQSKRLPKNTIK